MIGANLKLQSWCILHEKCVSVQVTTLAIDIPSKTISFSREHRITKQSQTKSASSLDGTNSPPLDNSFRSTSCDAKVRCLHKSREFLLMGFVATESDMVVETSLSSSSKMASTISSAVSSNRSLMESRVFSESLSAFSFQKLILSLISDQQLFPQKLIFSSISDQQLKSISELKTSLKITRDLPILIHWYCEKRISMVSFWNLAVLMNSYLSSINLSIRSTWAWSVVTRADFVWQVNLKVGDAYWSSIESANVL